MTTSVLPTRTWFSHPILSVLIAVSWMALMHSIEIFHVLAGVAIGLVIPRLIQPFLGDRHRVNWPKALHLTGIVLWDIVISNITVARLVLGRLEHMHPIWIAVPLASAHPTVNALFAMIITTTPGTVSAVVDEQRGIIWVHALNGDDADAAAVEMKQRYEQPLLEIFAMAIPAPAQQEQR